MDKHTQDPRDMRIISPDPVEPRAYSTARDAVDALIALYERNTEFLVGAFKAAANSPRRFFYIFIVNTPSTTTWWSSPRRLRREI